MSSNILEIFPSLVTINLFALNVSKIRRNELFFNYFDFARKNSYTKRMLKTYATRLAGM